jgi:uroporphyrin-III C-methyltransferase
MTKTPSGKIYLVGAGPGDPELLTRKAYALLRAADVVLHDDLVPAAIVSLAADRALVVNVGKRCGTKRITQQQIHAQMIESARLGLTVVRLQSGDPAVFGRLGEELDALDAAGVPYEIVPGVTAGVAAAAAIGASLTDRRTSPRILLVSGHHAQGHTDQPPQNWRALVSSDTTLAVYMPGHDFANLQRELLGAGLPSNTPCVIVSRASTPDQEQFRTTLEALSAAPALEAPSILLVGRTLARTPDAIERSANGLSANFWRFFWKDESKPSNARGDSTREQYT